MLVKIRGSHYSVLRLNLSVRVTTENGRDHGERVQKKKKTDLF